MLRYRLPCYCPRTEDYCCVLESNALLRPLSWSGRTVGVLSAYVGLSWNGRTSAYMGLSWSGRTSAYVDLSWSRRTVGVRQRTWASLLERAYVSVHGPLLERAYGRRTSVYVGLSWSGRTVGVRQCTWAAPTVTVRNSHILCACAMKKLRMRCLWYCLNLILNCFYLFTK